MSSKGSQASLNEIYRERNLVVALATALAAAAKKGVTAFRSENDPDWVVVFIWLDGTPLNGPSKQLSWHLPLAEFQEFFPWLPVPDAVDEQFSPWDKHTTEEKEQRIKRYVSHIFW